MKHAPLICFRMTERIRPRFAQAYAACEIDSWAWG